MFRFPTRSLQLLVVLQLVLSTSLMAQQSDEWDSGRLELPRATLEELLAGFEDASASEVYSPEFRLRARLEAERIRSRLENGDYQAGDQIALTVEGEESLTGPFVVSDLQAITLPAVGSISLRGVLRSELEPYLRSHIANFILNPVVTAHSSIRILISGEIARPGYYVIGTQSLLSAVVMEAGGPLPTADLSMIRIERANEVVLEGDDLQVAIAQGQTVNRLSIQSGDNIVIPAVESRGVARAGQILMTALPLVVLMITTAIQLF